MTHKSHNTRWYLSWIVLVLLAISLSSCAGTLYVRRPPPPPQIDVRPLAPGPDMIWITGNWYWSHHHQRHLWRHGRWIKRRKGHRWHPGHWHHSHRGWHWRHGKWVR